MKVGILGLGLIGGSLAKALKARRHLIVTVKRECADQALALQEGVLDEEYETLEELVQEVELLILASPLSTIVPIAKEISRLKQSKPLLVLDLSSVKGEIVSELEKLSHASVEFLSTHPMAGSEKRGFANSKADLFLEAPWILTAHGKNSREALSRAKTLIASVGGKPLFLSAEEHDKQAALVSHLPYLLSHAFLHFVKETHAESLQIAGPGFCSLTRLAHDNPLLHAEIWEKNQSLIRLYARQFIQFLERKL